MSHDLEDIITLLISHPQLVVGELRNPKTRLARHVKRALYGLLSNEAGRELVEVYSGHDRASQERGFRLWEELSRNS